MSPKASAKYILRLNTRKVLKLIRENPPISRAEISKLSGLSAPTVSRIVEDLIKEGLVEEIGAGLSNGGRRPNLLRFCPDNNFIIGIDLGTTNIYGVLANLEAEIISEEKVPTQVEEGFYSVMDRTFEVIEKLKAQLGKKQSHLCGVGMAVAGLINKKRNIVEFSPNFHWHDADIVGYLAQKTDIPIFFDNVTRVMALGELFYGIGRKYKNFICVNVGYGIGAGIIINGQPLYGTKGMSGEFGHITLEKDSKIQCYCGNFGCLEALSSGNGIARAARLELENGAKSILLDMCEGNLDNLTAEMVANAAKKGDVIAWNVFHRAAEYLGIGISALINLYNPEAIVIGGGVTQAGDILFDTIRNTVKARALNKISREVEILPATFGLKAAVMGAVSLIMEKVLNLDYKKRTKTGELSYALQVPDKES
ncbi:MAG: ROK family transcriptional regulator [Candidatus Aminicenantes bacterium]|jgi:glucokinase-like ROK family protein|nr:ROK family transcriptional regulator [Candidatus Aminicenantes bacterium]